jgi:glutaconate CoA-transferase subunit A
VLLGSAERDTGKYLKDYVHSVADHGEYLERIGVTRLLGLQQTFR